MGYSAVAGVVLCAPPCEKAGFSKKKIKKKSIGFSIFSHSFFSAKFAIYPEVSQIGNPYVIVLGSNHTARKWVVWQAYLLLPLQRYIKGGNCLGFYYFIFL